MDYGTTSDYSQDGGTGGLVVIGLLVGVCVLGWHMWHSWNESRVFFKGESSVMACERPYYDSSRCFYVTGYEMDGRIYQLGSSITTSSTECDVAVSGSYGQKLSSRRCKVEINNGDSYAVWDVYPSTTDTSFVNI